MKMRSLVFGVVILMCFTLSGKVFAWDEFSLRSQDIEAVRKGLTGLRYDVVVNAATEPPYNNAYWNHDEEGIYVDVVSGEPLFSSTDKYNSGTGWPCFIKPIVDKNIIENPDESLGLNRTELRSKFANSHLGHVFKDGPLISKNGEALGGLRYCVNSAALKFISKKDLKETGYEEFLSLFDKKS